MLFLSIIIPIYNVEPYIGRCIESILSQITESVDSVEVIMVNDGDSGRFNGYSKTSDIG